MDKKKTMELIMEFLVNSYPALLTDDVLKRMVQNNYALIVQIKTTVTARLEKIWVEKCTGTGHANFLGWAGNKFCGKMYIMKFTRGNMSFFRNIFFLQVEG